MISVLIDVDEAYGVVRQSMTGKDIFGGMKKSKILDLCWMMPKIFAAIFSSDVKVRRQ